tara:strand:+ start:270 stop:614 length:345 start_codon:yes stop_codon:yes gene_type:complete
MKIKVEMEISAVATQKVTATLTPEELQPYMDGWDEKVLRLTMNLADDVKWSNWEYDSLETEQITTLNEEDPDGPYDGAYCWHTGRQIGLTPKEKKRLQRISMLEEELEKLRTMP